ncbi:MAG: hypothetical protein A3J68_02150 [Candidatus Wildermuthbacteria bacterium RIFCSPHIGHO2_02_FULL_48_16]|uniref:Large ribosomal subunit protein bL25 n=2 Tax=Candidatus Wildermuthiibacteriota TaxID=1817923 RepID=A0A1G2R8P3_9BACT|nr:MAG: hypothetical protein A2842_00185 [Candidatus Wildermuthbacteria bacterium RIFCSPHIGHO2_01_FULL_48_25]OHA69210.1 MAG: hypothetical protein A3J68_02150 [Candidatus Wildermuthbacteria bacterium RIFCSPHIGHO2_02_FULL_48_16]OHA73896.1 MAG: hypothetical protein A3B24_03470 [Candidatus Wildermuthbacteria bacterium RIFCSPLOWO2_01_FULL_48_16]
MELTAVIRKKEAEKVDALRAQGKIPAVLYGPGKDAVSLILDKKEFEKVFKEAGESTLVILRFDKEELPVLIHDIQRDPVSSNILHTDLYQPPLDKKIALKVPLVFEGVPLAVRDLAGTLIKNIQEVEVRALPRDLPHEISVNVENLATFEARILLKDLLSDNPNVEILGHEDEIVAQVVPPEKVEEELALPVEEKVEDVEKIEKEKKEEEGEEETAAGEAAPKEPAKEKK